MFHRLPHLVDSCEDTSLHTSIPSTLSFSNTIISLLPWFPSSRNAYPFVPPDPRLSLPTPSGSQSSAPVPRTPGQRRAPSAHHPDFAPSTLPIPLAPQASAAPAPHPSTNEQHAPRLRHLTAHDVGGAVRKASGERLARLGAHTSLSGNRRAWKPGGTPTRVPLGCDSRDKDCLHGLPGSPATASWPRPSARTASPPPLSAGPIGPRPRRSRADPASLHRPAHPPPSPRRRWPAGG